MIGKVLIELGVLTEDELRYALDRQRELRQRGYDLLIGQILVEMGMISEHQLRAALERQRKSALGEGPARLSSGSRISRESGC